MSQSKSLTSEGARMTSHPKLRVETRRGPLSFRIRFKSLEFLAMVIEVAANLKTLFGS